MFRLFFFLLLLPSAHTVYFQITRFEPNTDNILYLGDAAPSVGAIELINRYTYVCRVGRAIYSERVPLWDSDTGILTNFSTHFSFVIDTQGRAEYGHGLAFFLAPVGFEVPLNSAGGFLGLFNTTTSDSSLNQIVHVEFDSYVNQEWDPPFEHVGINNNSIASTKYTSWNASSHSGDTADVWVTYDASKKNLSVSWKYQTTSNPQVNTSLSFEIDLMQVLPEWVIVGFSAGTSQFGERNKIQSWEFSSSLERKERRGKNANKKSLVVGLTVLAGVLIAVAIVTCVILLFAWKVKKKEEESNETLNLTSINEDLERGAGPRRFSYRYLASATNNFSDDKKLGEGGFGAVYRGYLIDLDIPVAVKKISRGSKQGRKEYITEVKIISRIRHRNLVQLIGWCHDNSEFLLVYEFMPNGSLDMHLFSKRSPLTWAVRYKIASGLASALLYLHEEWEKCVVHRDIKSSNVMLDSSFNVKLGDFGLARLMDHELGPQTTGLAGTLGYMAPEYIATGRASKESDVYSYGVVTLEIATGRKSTDPPEKDSAMGLLEWVWNLYGSGRLHVAIDKRLHMDFEEKEIECLMIVGLWCAHPDRSLRPSIRQAIQVLHFEAAMPNLPLNMPVPLYHVPTPLVSSGEPFITTSLDDGR
ncbi:L-type lectin-domain containing receptor kinase IX.1-like [Juglans microcarpa x Juglans regia]|uniref:L-type lectin-domain containing receptor kinase IX.1-like n=1 Tax=Juglans microcarpa x Juglans regia TaxID=2249226 RepID=UPI001B7E64BD|nr:L-type lectin-domain containing receptor kinase IX.1-like [Juglans microcarpa x Juglans regia]